MILPEKTLSGALGAARECMETEELQEPSFRLLEPLTAIATYYVLRVFLRYSAYLRRRISAKPPNTRKLSVAGSGMYCRTKSRLRLFARLTPSSRDHSPGRP